jgi:hypothetical protein
MSGNTAAASLWANADVLVTSNLAAVIPPDESTPFTSDWSFVGLLDGDKGIERNMTETETDHYAWGGILVATTRTKHKETKQFTCLEDNAVTRSLIWPGSSPGQLVVPRPTDILIAFHTYTGGKVHRLISAHRAQVVLAGGKVLENETDMTAFPLEATVYPDSTGLLYYERPVTTGGQPGVASIALTPLTLALSLAGAYIKKVVATATYTDATTGDVSGTVNWITSVPAKASVSSDGFVTGLTTGVTNVSCNLGGVTSTAPCVVTVAA